ncbi:MAG: GNAT family N-acetyltransferase [Planctomycetota bacterium]
MTSPAHAIQLKPITRPMLRDVLALSVEPQQQKFVAPNVRSLAEAYVDLERAWPRALCIGDKPIGFAMLELLGPDHPEAPDGKASYFLWRYMIYAEHQRKGYGTTGLDLIVAHVRTLPDGDALGTSYVPGDGCPGPFYERYGFRPTGEVDDGEIVLRLAL